MIPIRCGAYAIGIVLLAAATPVAASEDRYAYSVLHPVYGEIGNLDYSIEHSANAMRISSRLRIAVSILGIIAYRCESDSIELWRADRLVMLQSTMNKDGRRIEVRGEARGEKFLVTSEAGTVDASPEVAPPDPWLVKGTGVSTVVSTATGKILHVHISGGESVVVPIQGIDVAARHFSIDDEKHQEVWLDRSDIPVMFRSIEDGEQIDFVLKTPLAQSPGTP
ncbi:MAG: DUF6134 family protein [Acidobacteriota bacterium]